jgi:spore germination protein
VRTKTLKIWTMVLAVAFFVAAIWGYYQYLDKRQAMVLLENEYQRSFYSMVDSVENLNFLTGKAQISGEEQSLAILAQISSEAKNVQNNLSSLPLDQTSLIRTSKYFNQLSDYSDMLFKKVSRGHQLSEAEQAQIASFYKEINTIYQEMALLEKATGEGNVRFSVAQKAKRGDSALQVMAGNVNDTNGNVYAMDYFNKLNDKLSDIKTLNYKGKYSDHMVTVKPKGVLGKTISKAQARKIAEELLRNNNFSAYKYRSLTQLDEAPIPVFSLTFISGEKSANISVSKKGGKIISVFIARDIGTAKIDNEKAIKNANQFLEKMGYKGMKIIAQEREDNKLLLTFAREEANILYYTDKVLVQIALDDGSVVSFNAQDYWINFRERKLPDVKVTAREAQDGLHKSFVFQNGTLALIEDGAGGEILCHEFRGKCGDDEYIININSQEGVEENIFRNVTSENGFYTR